VQEDERAGESLSIENQKLILTKYVKEQGWNLVDLSGKRVGETIDGLHVFSLDEIGYGTITGFKGVNCGHDWFAYIEGISTPNYTQEQLEEMNARNIEYNGKMYTQYEINQMQRAGEQKVRMLKRRCVLQEEALRNATDPETKAVLQQKYQSTAAKLKDTEQQLKTFCRDTGNNRDRFREQVYGFGRSEAQKAVQVAKKVQGLTSGGNDGIIRDERIVRAVENGEITLTLNPEKQKPHILGSDMYKPSKHKSYFTCSLEELQEILLKYYGTGKVIVNRTGQIKEIIEIDHNIGVDMNEQGVIFGETNRFTVHYSKGRTHIVPSERKEKR
jgi:hypothetical protein